MISLKTHKMLWGRSANICAFPNCKQQLVVDETETDDPSLIGEESHIVARKENGPRGKSDLSEHQRDKYDNLILLCNMHHKIVDDQENKYTVDLLKKYKNAHEKWVLENLKNDLGKIKDDELYATYVEHFMEAVDVENWNSLTSWMFGSGNCFQKLWYDKLINVSNYIVSRIWPNRYPSLEFALINFKNILNDLNNVFQEYSLETKNSYQIERFYRDAHSDELYQKFLDRYNYHVELIMDLLIELTRALNYISDKIREFVFEAFRLSEGVTLITLGDMLGYQSHRVEYRGEERTDFPYPGLKNFMLIRNDRDLKIGSGVNEYYFRSY